MARRWYPRGTPQTPRRNNGPMEEAWVRAAIASRSRTCAPPEPHLLIPELALCQAEARIDLAVVERSRLVGWEIKTRADRLTRLPQQQQVYSRVFDRVWLAADVKHIEAATAVIPEWWGIVRIEADAGQCRLVQVRSSRLNRGVDLYSLVRLLWRDEVLSELARVGLGEGQARSPKRELWAALAAAAPRFISAAQLRSRVRTRLMSRDDWRADRPRM